MTIAGIRTGSSDSKEARALRMTICAGMVSSEIVILYVFFKSLVY